VNPAAIFAGAAGKTALVASSAAAGVFVFLGLTVYQVVWKAVPLDYAGWGIAWASVLGASAAAIAGHAWGQAKATAASGGS
jgi:hypothetical protein